MLEIPPAPPPVLPRPLPVLRAGTQLGRFRLVSVLGRGAQATVWRAFDERLGRQVALKLLTASPNGTAGAGPHAWQHEARVAGRLAHPHIVPVFDADQIDGQTLLVFELVPGKTLAEARRGQGPMPARDAVELMLGVVDALRAAHSQGIVHRDLKPSNILLDTDGRARVMDFGVAAWLAQAAEPDPTAGCIVGTPGYLSPEAAAGAAPTPQMDVFGLGLVLAELLTGVPLLVERDAEQALRRVREQDLVLPDDVAVDDRLRAVVQLAIARDPSARYDSAASLRDALMQWLEPPDLSLPEPGAGHGTLDFLLRRMRYKSDFPALTEHVLRIQRMASSDSENLNRLADEILKDVALTQKLLRLVNTVKYRRNGVGISSISRAVALVGLAGIRNLALSLVLVEHMKDKAHAQRLKAGFLRSLLAGQIASTLCTDPREAEEVFLGAMFYNLGGLLTEYYFPDEAEAIRTQLRHAAETTAHSGGAPIHPDLLADRAAGVVLGLGFEALGVGVAKHWGLPESLQRCMRRPDTASPHHPVAPGPERLRWLAIAANEIADAVWHSDEESLPVKLEAVVQRHGRALDLRTPAVAQATEAARLALSQMAPAMGLVLPVRSKPKPAAGAKTLQVNPNEAAVAKAAAEAATVVQPRLDTSADTVMAAGAAKNLGGATPADPAAAPATSDAGVAKIEAAVRQARAGVAPHPAVAPMATDPPQPASADSDRAVAALSAGIGVVASALANDGVKINQVLHKVMDTMQRALGLQRVVFCLREPASGMLTGRFGLGDRAAALSPHFKVALQWPAGQAPDLFGALCLKARDTVIADCRASAIAARLPDWYRQQVNAPSLLLLPMMLKGAPFGLIYADWAPASSNPVGERELALLRTLRNQAVMGFRQAKAPA